MSFNYPVSTPTLIPADNNFRSLKLSTVYPIKTIGPYTSWKLPVRVATTANITLTGLQTIDGISLNNEDRVLVKNQNTGGENGIYVCLALSVWSRANDLENGSNSANICMFVNESSTNAELMYMCTNIFGSDLVGTDDLVFDIYGDVSSVVPGGSNTNVQYNDSGTFAGSSSFTFNPTSIPSSVQFPVTVVGLLTLGSAASSPSGIARITSASATASSGQSGKSIALTSGAGDGAGSGGSVSLYGGYSTAVGGSINILAGNGTSTLGGNVNIYSGTSTATSGDIILTADNSGSTKGIINLITSGITTSFKKGGIQFTKDTGVGLTIANLSAPPTVTTTSRQGIITVTDPSALTAGASINITVNNVNTFTNDIILVTLQDSVTRPALVSTNSLNTGVSFIITLSNIGSSSLLASAIKIQFVMV